MAFTSLGIITPLVRRRRRAYVVHPFSRREESISYSFRLNMLRALQILGFPVGDKSFEFHRQEHPRHIFDSLPALSVGICSNASITNRCASPTISGLIW